MDGSGSGRFTSLAEGEERLGSIRPMTNFPIMVVATTTTEHALADWRAQTKLQFGAALLAVIVVIVTISLIVRQLKRQHLAAQHLLVEKGQHLDTAINNMTQGLLLFDASGRLVICNQRLYRNVRRLAGRGEAGLSSPRSDSASPATSAPSSATSTPTAPNSSIRTGTRLSATPSIDLPDGRMIQLIYKRSAGRRLGHDTRGHHRAAAASRRRIEHLAHYDALTDLPNRTLFQRHAEQLLAQLREAFTFAILYIDIDEFKGINDSLGHLIGDEFLRAVSPRLRAVRRHEGFRGAARRRRIRDRAARRRATEDDVAALIDTASSRRCGRRSIATAISLSGDASIGIALAPARRHRT